MDLTSHILPKAIPALDFKACADPLQVVVSCTPSAVRDNNSASPTLVNDMDLLRAVALQPCSFTTGGYGWKGKERLAINLVDPTDGKKTKVRDVNVHVLDMVELS